MHWMMNFWNFCAKNELLHENLLCCVSQCWPLYFERKNIGRHVLAFWGFCFKIVVFWYMNVTRFALILCKQKNGTYWVVFADEEICVWPNRLVNGGINDNMWSMTVNLDCINIAKVLMLPKELKNMKIILHFYRRNMHLDPHL